MRPQNKTTQFLHGIEFHFWWLFLVCSALSFVIIPFEIGERTLENWISHRDLRAAMTKILSVWDIAWIYLAATVTYLATIRPSASHADNGHAIRKTALTILFASALVTGIGAMTGFPFGSFIYTSTLGHRIGGVLPIAVPFLWFTILCTSKHFARFLLPQANRWTLGATAGVFTLLTDLNLEFIAWKVRAYWIWYPPGTALAQTPPSWPPIQNYLSWFLIAFLLTAATWSRTSPPRTSLTRPILILLIINALFLFTHITRAIWF